MIGAFQWQTRRKARTQSFRSLCEHRFQRQRGCHGEALQGAADIRHYIPTSESVPCIGRELHQRAPSPNRPRDRRPRVHRSGRCFRKGKRDVDDNKRLASMDAQAGPPPGPTLYIINLCASLAPVPTNGNTLPGLDNYRLYQVARVEDGRTRHRLRLGFFTSESHANSVLAVVRQKYPTAFVASLSAEDRRFTRGHLPAAADEDTAPAAARAVANGTATPPPARNGATSPATINGNKSAAAPNGALAKAAASSAAANTTAARGIPVSNETTAGTNAIRNGAHSSAADGTKSPAVVTRNGTRAATPSPAAPKQPPATQARRATAAKPPAGPADVIEVTWEPDDATRAEASSARLKALTEDECLDEFTWEGPALTAADTASTAPTAADPPATASPDIPVLTLTDTASMRVLALTPGDAPSFKSRSASPARAPNSPTNTAAQSAPNGRAPGAPPRPLARPVGSPGKPSPQLRPPPAAPAPLPDEFDAPLLDPMAGPVGLDSTQTLRALTNAELSDAAPEKWFAIQLVASEQPANLDTMPHLDIFEAYRLYSVALAAEGRITHSLRLGFFKEDVSAEAVCGYLKTFFPAPVVLRVSLAEQLRFKDAPQPRRPSAEEARSNVIELNDARAGRNAAPLTLAEPPAPPPAQPAAAIASAAARTSPAPRSAAPAVAPQPAVARNGAPVLKRPQATRTKPSSKYRAKKTLTDALMDEARDVELGASGSRKAPQNNSLLSRLVGKLTK